jgi:hypothetical protein
MSTDEAGALPRMTSRTFLFDLVEQRIAVAIK